MRETSAKTVTRLNISFWVPCVRERLLERYGCFVVVVNITGLLIDCIGGLEMLCLVTQSLLGSGPPGVRCHPNPA
jgi:hypothetical protein